MAEAAAIMALPSALSETVYDARKSVVWLQALRGRRLAYHVGDVEQDVEYVSRSCYFRLLMSASPSLHSSDPTAVAEPEPVLQDSLRYWERQSATYNGVLGVCAVTLSYLSTHLKLSSFSNRGLRLWCMLSSLSVRQAD